VAAGTSCDAAIVEIEEVPVKVLCTICGSTSDARANRLLCASCGAWRVALVSGDEMLLARVESAATLNSLPRERADV
jgi:hydrogenase nickel incorporation protein HypA/HybF